MITLKHNSENKFLIYKTNITGLDGDCLVKIQNKLSDKTLYLDFSVNEVLRAYEVTIPVTNLRAFEGQNLLIIEDSSAIIYSEECSVNDLQ